MELLLRGCQTMRLIRVIHNSMSLILRGRLMMRLLNMEPLLIRGLHLRSNISCSWTHSKTSLTICHHLLDEAPDTQPALIVLITIALELSRELSMHQCN